MNYYPMAFVRVLCFLFLLSSTTSAQNQTPLYSNDIAKASSDPALLKVYENIYSNFKEANNDSCSAYLHQGLKTFAEHNYLPGKAAMLGMLASTYNSEGLSEDAKNAADACLKIYTELNDKKGIAKIRNVIGVIEGQAGNYDIAIKNFLIALKYFESISDTVNLVNTYVKLGKANMLSGFTDTALNYYQKGLALSLKIKPSANTAYLYNNIASYYGKKENYKLALENLQKAIDYCKDSRFALAKVYTLTNFGNLYMETNKKDKALSYFQQGLKIAKDGNMKEEYATLLSKIGLIESIDQKQMSKNLENAFEIARELGNKPLELDILNNMIQASETYKNYGDEVTYLKKVSNIKDSLFSIQQSREIANLQATYELNKSQTQLVDLEKSEQQNQHNKNIIIIIAIILLCTLLVLFSFFINSLQLNKKLSIREKELEKANNVKDRLFSIIGHDLKGPIGSIPQLINIYKSEDTTEEEKEFILNSLEENSIASFDTLEKLLQWGKLQIKGNALNKTKFSAVENMSNMLQLLKVSAENKNIQFVNQIPADIKLEADENHFKFVMRNLLSNGVKYTRTNGTIVINAIENSKDNFVTFSVKDNGIGIEKEKQAHIFEPYNYSTLGTDDELGTSIGLMLSKEFILANGGTIWVESEKGVGTTFYFTVLRA